MAGKGQAAVLGHKEKVEIWEKLKVLSEYESLEN